MAALTALVVTVGGFVLLIAGAETLVRGLASLAKRLAIAEIVIGSTIIAAGISLPELATSAVAACRGRSDIAVGNIVGSNIFNVLAILGVSAVIYPGSYAAAFNADPYVLIATTVFLFFHVHRPKVPN